MTGKDSCDWGFVGNEAVALTGFEGADEMIISGRDTDEGALGIENVCKGSAAMAILGITDFSVK